MGGEADQEKCIPIPQLIGIRQKVTGTLWTDIPIAVEVKQMGDRTMTAYTWYLGSDLDIEAIHPSQSKITKRQRTGNKPMAASTWRADFSLRAETDFYLKQVRQMGKSLITASMQ